MGDDGRGGAAEPLLRRARYHPNCPGCRVDRRKEEDDRFPFRDLCCMWLVTICSALPIQFLFPFLYFMSQDLRASANGLSITLMSIFKAIAPAVAGIVFSWAQRRQTAPFLPGDHLVFFMLNVFTAFGLMFTFKPFFTRGSTKH